jgi:hypothetical protein
MGQDHSALNSRMEQRYPKSCAHKKQLRMIDYRERTLHILKVEAPQDGSCAPLTQCESSDKFRCSGPPRSFDQHCGLCRESRELPLYETRRKSFIGEGFGWGVRIPTHLALRGTPGGRLLDMTDLKRLGP